MNLTRFTKGHEMSDDSFALLSEALAYLSCKQRLILHLRFWENMTIQEIGHRIGHSWESTDDMLESAIHHARVRIIQLSHAHEEADLLRTFLPIAA